jgi:hypothetical protein
LTQETRLDAKIFLYPDELIAPIQSEAMPFDPFSIIGYVGTAAGLCGFLVSTVARSEEAIRNFGAAKHKLKRYERRLRNAQSKLKTWARIWFQGDNRRETFIYFWGRDGFDQILQQIDAIRIEINAIGLLLYKDFSELPIRTEVTSRQWALWAQLELDDYDRVRRVVAREPDVIDRILFAAFRVNNFEDRTKNLRDMVSDLVEDSASLLWKCQFQPEFDKKVNESTLASMLDNREWLQTHSGILVTLYNLSIGHGIWSLVLTPPTSLGGPVSMPEGTIRVEFDVQEVGILPIFPFEIEGNELQQWYQGAIVSQDLIIPNERSRYFKDLLPSLLADGEHFTIAREVLLRAALGIVNWTMLLWNTPWTEGICSCGLRFITLPPTPGRPVALASFTRRDVCDKDPERGQHLQRRKAALMGVSLAELALRRPITISDTTSRAWLFTIDGSEKTERFLLADVRRETRSPGFALAVKYCFEYDRHFWQGGIFRAEDIVLFEKNVLDRYVVISHVIHRG